MCPPSDKNKPEETDPEAILATLEHVSKTLDMLTGVVHRLNTSLHHYMVQENETSTKTQHKPSNKNLH